MRTVVSIASALALGALAGDALAHGWRHGGYGHGGWRPYRGGVGVGIVIGTPWALPPVVVAPPVVRVVPPYGYGYAYQAPPAFAGPQGLAVWYWCPDPAGYYPNVVQCWRPWAMVPVQ